MTCRSLPVLLLGLGAAVVVGSPSGAASTTTTTAAATSSTTSTTIVTAPGSAFIAPAKSVRVHGSVVAMTRPLSNGTMWVLAGSPTKKNIYQVNIGTGKVIGSEVVSPHADDIALSPNGATVALGTTGGAYPAVVWYSGLTGRFANASRQAAAVTGVASNAAGNVLYALRGTVGIPSVFALGTSNGLGFTYPIAVGVVDLAPTPQGSLLLLQSSGVVGTLTLPKGTYANSFNTGAPSRAMALSPDGTTLFVLRTTSGSAAGSIAEVNVATGTVVESIPVPSNCVDLALSLDGHTLYEALRGRSTSTIKPVVVP